MKSRRHLIPLIAATLFSLPGLVSAGGVGIGSIDSTLTFNLRLTGEGEGIERNGVFSNRFTYARFGPREALYILSHIGVALPGSEVESRRRFPAGSRIVVLGRDDRVVVMDRAGNELFDATPYLGVEQNSDSIRSGTFNTNNGDENSNRMYIAGFYFQFPFIGGADEGGESLAGLEGSVNGLASENYSRRISGRGDNVRVTTSSRVNARVSGSGNEDGEPLGIVGSLGLSGRETRTDID